MKMSSLVLTGMLLTGSVFADGVETRTDKTANAIPVMVGSCSVSQKRDPISNQEVYETTLPVTNCQEYKTYQANVSGKFWNKKIAPIEGTEKYSYRMEDATQISAGVPASDIVAGLNALNACNEKKNLLLQLTEARKGQAKCSL